MRRVGPPSESADRIGGVAHSPAAGRIRNCAQAVMLREDARGLDGGQGKLSLRSHGSGTTCLNSSKKLVTRMSFGG